MGEPASRNVYMRFPLSWLLCSLYQAVRGIDWYGVFMEAMFVVCATCIFYRICHRCSSPGLRLYFTLLFITLWIITTFAMMIQVQFTTTAGICGATAFFMFITSDGISSKEYLISNIPAILLAWTAYAVRHEILFMILPVTAAAGVAKILCEKRPVSKEVIKKYGSIICLFLAGFLLISICHTCAYADAGWADSLQKDKYRVQVRDYTGWADFDENSDVFEEAGIAREDYNLLKSGVVYIGSSLTVEQWKVIAEVAAVNGTNAKSYTERLLNILSLTGELLFGAELRPVNLIVVVLFTGILVMVLRKRKKPLTIVFVGIVLGQVICWLIIAYRGRVAARIEYPYLWIWLLGMIGLWWHTEPVGGQPITKKANIFHRLFMAMLLGTMAFIALKQVETAEERVIYSAVHEKDWNGLKSYCKENKDNLYVWLNGSNTLFYYYDRIFDSSLASYENYIYIGSSRIMDPNTEQKLCKWGIDDLLDAIVNNPKVLLVFQKDFFTENHELLKYYEAKGKEISYEIVDTFKTENLEYEVYRLSIQR